LRLDGASGQRVRVQRSLNLLDWDGQGANLSFLDGHVAWKGWRNAVRERDREEVVFPRNATDKEDLMWLADRTQLGQHRHRLPANQ